MSVSTRLSRIYALTPTNDSGIGGGVVSQNYFKEYFGLLNPDGTTNQSKSDNVSSLVVSVLQAGAFFGALGSAPISGERISFAGRRSGREFGELVAAGSSTLRCTHDVRRSCGQTLFGSAGARRLVSGASSGHAGVQSVGRRARDITPFILLKVDASYSLTEWRCELCDFRDHRCVFPLLSRLLVFSRPRSSYATLSIDHSAHLDPQLQSVGDGLFCRS